MLCFSTQFFFCGVHVVSLFELKARPYHDNLLAIKSQDKI